MEEKKRILFCLIISRIAAWLIIVIFMAFLEKTLLNQENVIQITPMHHNFHDFVVRLLSYSGNQRRRYVARPPPPHPL